MAGLEGDFAWANIRGTVNDPFFAGKNFSSKTDWIATGTGRIGYSFDRVLFYGKGGGAWAHNRFDMTFFGGTPATATETRFGWTLGAGIEYMLTPNWSAKFEYNHYDFGGRQIVLAGVGFAGPFTAPENISQRIDTVKVGINYRFWSPPAAVVARY
ncbi:MAG TPA: outer membrane beta-barrel protein [Xanthobacteraceae bacterium]|nr:outer membrane beta-barrel protein [Xanthobacteraceae bacterium]